MIETITMGVIYACPECGFSTTDPMALETLVRHDERVSPGEIEPAGQCPECAALIPCPDDDIPSYTLDHIAQVMRERGWVVAEPGVKT